MKTNEQNVKPAGISTNGAFARALLITALVLIVIFPSRVLAWGPQEMGEGDRIPPNPHISRSPVADASATPTVVISPNGSNATVTLDGSRSQLPTAVSYSYSPGLTVLETEISMNYAWYEDERPPVLANKEVATVTLPVGTHSIGLGVSAVITWETEEWEYWAANDSDTVFIEIITTTQAVRRLAEAVSSTAGSPRPLAASLEAAAAALERGDSIASLNQLRAFQNKLRAQNARANNSLANELITASEQVIIALGER